jgi:acyl dehydratase
MTERRSRSWTLTSELLRAYSRRGNFHSDPDAARAAGLSGLVAQGMQAAAPAYGLLLDAWGDDWLAHGELALRFVAPVRGGDTVQATVDLDADAARLEIAGTEGDVRVVGSARRRASDPEPA